MWGFVPRLAATLLTQRRCRSFLLSKVIEDVWNSNASSPHPAHRGHCVSLPFFHCFPPILVWVVFPLWFLFFLLYLQKIITGKSIHDNLPISKKMMFHHNWFKFILLFYILFSGQNDHGWGMFSRWTTTILGSSALDQTSQICHIHLCAVSPFLWWRALSVRQHNQHLHR